MEENLQTPQPVYPTNTIPDVSSVNNSSGSNIKFTFALIVGLIVLVVGLSSYAYLNLNHQSKNLATTQSVAIPTLTPTPTVYVPNPKDTSPSAINNDTSNLNQNITNLGNDVQDVNQSFSDQQPNLQ
jgi:peptidoglycan hydrolase CwlO-like protein